jgi:DNA polymerase, archaea type
MAAGGNTVNEVKALLASVNDIFQKYAAVLKERRMPIEELVFTKRLSKNSSEYQNRDTMENSVLHFLESEGKYLKAGEILKYVITNYYSRQKRSPDNNRAIPIELIDDDNNNNMYDIRRYTELLAKTCNSVTEPFDHTPREEQNYTSEYPE